MWPQLILHGQVMAYHSCPGRSAASSWILLAAIKRRFAITAGAKWAIVDAAVAAAAAIVADASCTVSTTFCCWSAEERRPWPLHWSWTASSLLLLLLLCFFAEVAAAASLLLLGSVCAAAVPPLAVE